MTKAENRAAAKAYHREQQDKLRQEIRAERVAEDLKHLGALRHYLIFGSRTGAPRDALQTAIDDYVERLTGDRTALHSQTSSG